MKRPTLFLSAFWCIYFYSSCLAAETTSSAVANTAPGNLPRILVSLIVVVGLLIAAAVVFKKLGLNQIHSAFPVKVIGAISIGSNQRIMLIEAGNEWIVLGVTSQHISPITRIPRPENSESAGTTDNLATSTWLQTVLEKYRVKKS